MTLLTPPKLPSFLRRANKSASTVAAVDLGSNSFHMIVAQVVDGELRVLDRLQEMVRLAGGLDDKGRLSKESQRRALACLQRFGQRLRGMHASSVRAVGTNTLRRARQAEKFLAAAQKALGHRIEVIAGREEARLIYQGVARDLPNDENRLVIDIGGGSTELIVGVGTKAQQMESLYMGCVGMSRAFFHDGAITPKRFKRAETAARLECAPVEALFRANGKAVYGSSGTIRAIASVVRASGWSDDDITLASLKKLREAVMQAGETDRLMELPGLNPDRAPVFAGGLAILIATFEAFALERMKVSDNALREGLLQDLVGRLKHQDVRAQTVEALSGRYQVDAAQASRVAKTSQALFEQAREGWQLTDDDRAMLVWSARLHEVGLAVAHTHYHRHGAYLVQYSDLPGFSSDEQLILALLVRAHRRKFPLEEWEGLPKARVKKIKRLSVLLRLAVLLHRARNEVALPDYKLRVHKRRAALQFPARYLSEHPLTEADLDEERRYLKAVAIELSFK
jgi:exopolyphosphatase/guanosine-5'-triphosphate,3'-diphosphate pyrophosphatase